MSTDSKTITSVTAAQDAINWKTNDPLSVTTSSSTWSTSSPVWTTEQNSWTTYDTDVLRSVIGEYSCPNMVFNPKYLEDSELFSLGKNKIVNLGDGWEWFDEYLPREFGLVSSTSFIISEACVDGVGNRGIILDGYDNSQIFIRFPHSDYVEIFTKNLPDIYKLKKEFLVEQLKSVIVFESH